MSDAPALRDAEVGDLRAALVVDDDVVRLEVAVDDPAPVREARGAQDLHGEVDRAARVERRLVAGRGRLSVRPSRNSIAM